MSDAGLFADSAAHRLTAISVDEISSPGKPLGTIMVSSTILCSQEADPESTTPGGVRWESMGKWDRGGSLQLANSLQAARRRVDCEDYRGSG